MPPKSPAAIPPATVKKLRAALKAWYKKNGRDLPWRERVNDPYAVMVSEFMLQQTQVATVLPYYERFLDRFPTMEALAAADESTVRAAWSGLGYYRRARNLQSAARTIVSDHGGALPDELEGLRALPGVGDYTAAALGSIVHGLTRGVVDGNVIRVLTRLTAFEDPVSTAAAKHRLQDLADQLVDPSNPGDWNQAIMELGATVCTARNPACDTCPWTITCQANKLGTPHDFPRKTPTRKSVQVEHAVGILNRGTELLFLYREDARLLDGTWELPGVEVGRDHDPRTTLANHLETTLKTPVRIGAELTLTRHSITHRRLLIRGFDVQPARRPRAKTGERKWIEPGNLGEYPVSSMTTKLLQGLKSSKKG